MEETFSIRICNTKENIKKIFEIVEESTIINNKTGWIETPCTHCGDVDNGDATLHYRFVKKDDMEFIKKIYYEVCGEK